MKNVCAIHVEQIQNVEILMELMSVHVCQDVLVIHIEVAFASLL